MASPDTSLLERLHVPALLIRAEQVAFANIAAVELLGGHILGQDVRIALRHPEAVALLTEDRDGSVRLDGLSVPGSIWSMASHRLADGTRLVTLDDLSVRVSVARAHADFVANASHELRTPLAAILGYVETLQSPKAGADAETRERFLGIISHEARRMQALVEDLMSLSRIEAVKHDIPTAPLDLLALVRGAVGELRGTAEITVTANADQIPIAGDSGQIAQVIRNLIDNAIKYGKSDQPVEVTLEATDTGWVALTVRDHGDGIAPEHLPRLTERFYRADTGRSRAAGGTGLGLSIVKHIVERHRGRFDITSREGAGTTVSLMLPLLKT